MVSICKPSGESTDLIYHKMIVFHSPWIATHRKINSERAFFSIFQNLNSLTVHQPLQC